MRLLLLFLILTLGTLGSEYDAVLVRGDVYADWIIAQAYSHKAGVPIIATSPESLDPLVREQLKGYRGFGFDKVLIIGGERAVSQAVQQDVESMGFATHRISEADRSGTSARVALELFSDSERVILANGASNEALLVAGRLASVSGDPVLFVRTDEIPPSVSAALASMRVQRIIVVDLEIADGIKNSLRSGGYEVEVIKGAGEYRVDGSSRFSSVLLLLGGVLIGAVVVFIATRIMEREEKVPITVLTEDEKKVINAISERGGEITQDLLPELTSFSRPKVSRVISDLEERGVLSKEPYGRTQKIVIKKQFTEESQ